MRDYEKLVKGLKYCFEHDDCGSRCPYFSPTTVCADERAKEAADAIEELLSKVPHWISVEERLPETGERVLVSNGGFVCESFLSQSGKWQRGGVDMFFMTPTHWCEMPESPKEENKR